MEPFVDLTANNAARARDEILHYARKGGLEDLETVRIWIREAVRPQSHVAQLYRVLELDLEEDICVCLRAFESNPAHGAMASSYGLRMLWRVLMRRYAFWHAWSVGKRLRTYERLGLWLIIRRSSYLMPRLMVAVFAGFLLLSSSSTLMDILFRTSDKPWRAGVTMIALIVVYLLAAAEVQRRIGRASRGKLLIRDKDAVVGEAAGG